MERQLKETTAKNQQKDLFWLEIETMIADSSKLKAVERKLQEFYESL